MMAMEPTTARQKNPQTSSNKKRLTQRRNATTLTLHHKKEVTDATTERKKTHAPAQKRRWTQQRYSTKNSRQHKKEVTDAIDQCIVYISYKRFEIHTFSFKFVSVCECFCESAWGPACNRFSKAPKWPKPEFVAHSWLTQNRSKMNQKSFRKVHWLFDWFFIDSLISSWWILSKFWVAKCMVRLILRVRNYWNAFFTDVWCARSEVKIIPSSKTIEKLMVFWWFCWFLRIGCAVTCWVIFHHVCSQDPAKNDEEFVQKLKKLSGFSF